MNLPERHIQDLLDRLTHSRLGFALYRLPWTDECHLVLQASGEAEQPADIEALNGKQGFVTIPFRPSESHPPIVIRPDITAFDWEEIAQAVEKVSGSLPAAEASRDKETPTPIASDLSTDKATYTAAFERFIRPLQEKRFQKLVLSRCATYPLCENFSPIQAFVHACNSYPRMMIYLCHTPATGTWMGSTPEILLSGHGQEWHTVALAGTMPMKEDETMPTAWSEKNKEEQNYVADYIRGILKKFGSKVTEKGPYTARAGQLVHLKTDFHFLLKNTDRLGDLLQELHPTPAVCGLPKEEALRFIEENEGYDRRYYSGFTGWLDPEGHTDLYVNLRCMEIAGHQATLYAGGGILASSEMEAEWEETGEKMKTMKNILCSDFIIK